MHLKNKFFIGFLVFIVSFPLSLFIWTFIKEYYAFGIIKSGTFFINHIFDTQTSSLDISDNIVVLDQSKEFFTAKGELADLVLTIKIKISSFTFNFPLTVSLIAGIIPLIHFKKRKVIEIIFFLFFIHMCYVFTFLGLQEYQYLVRAGIIQNNIIIKMLWNYSWEFTDNLLLRFEPFLVPVYVYLTSNKK